METAGKAAPRSLPEALIRAVRHEVGDLLQTIYCSVAMLQKRLPADWNMERRLLSDMRARAEVCKDLLDTVYEFACPLTLSYERIDLAELAGSLVRAAAARHPQLRLRVEGVATLAIEADVRRLADVGERLLANACEAAREEVRFTTAEGPGPGEAKWTVTDDGPGVSPEQLPRLFTPFFTTRHGHPGLGLALVQKLVQLHGGQVTARNRPEGGFTVQVVLPAGPARSSSRVAK